MILHSLDRYRNHGLMALRIGIGIMFVLHGYPKIMGGEEKWAQIGSAMGSYGITVAPVFWGFMAAASEFFGGILLMTGLFFRPAAGLLFFTMLTAVMFHLGRGDSLMIASHAIESAILFFALMFIGPGKFSIDHVLATSPRGAFREIREECICETHGTVMDGSCA